MSARAVRPPMWHELILVSVLLTYVTLYAFSIHRSYRSRVGWPWAVLCMAPALYIAWVVFGAAYDMSFTVELVQFLRRRMSPWEMEHTFPYLPGYPVLLTPLAWFAASPITIARAAKLLNLGFLVWFGWTAGKTAFHDAEDAGWRGVLYFSCHPLLVAVSLWHGQFEIVVVTFLFIAAVHWQSSATTGSLRGGFMYGLAVSVKHWPVLALPVMVHGSPRRMLRSTAGMLAALGAVFTLHLVLNGRFTRFSRILDYSGIPSGVGMLQVFSLPELPGWIFLALALSLAAGFVLRLKRHLPAEAAMFTLLLFLLLSFRTAPQYWVWFLALAPFCLSDRDESFWLVSGSLAAIVMLQEWGFVLGWQGEYPHATWQGNYPRLRTYPHLSSAALWLYPFLWRPFFLIAAISAGVWYYRSFRPPALGD